MSECGVMPKRLGLGLSLAAISRLVDYPSDDLTITVEAGMTIAELGSHLAAKRQWLPVDVSRPDAATVGGVMAVDCAGPRRLGYGTMRDYVLGFTAVDGAGRVFSGGGRVVKNAAGYNMCRLLTGAWGTLGVVTQVTLLVRPQPETSVLLACDVPSFEIAEKLLSALGQSIVRPVAAEMVAGQPSENNSPSWPSHPGYIGRIYVGFEGSAAEVDAAIQNMRSLWGAAGDAELVPAERTAAVWRSLADFAADVQINVLPSAVVRTVAKILELDKQATVQAHAGDGVVLAKLSSPSVETISRLRSIAADVGGRMVVQRASNGQCLSGDEIWGERGPEFRIMRAIKERFDPDNILNPGRFVF
jgi:glycolate oxidase FAD binding subunit